jgi:hypothetical protein
MAVASGEADYARPIKSGEIAAPDECRPVEPPVSSRAALQKDRRLATSDLATAVTDV